ncbi:Chitinase 2 [Coemansia guatemalensis]|uniref:chitinase n=1 Tax=Coemansia guatemalensis TaxID=2761395 RepID=A0A9W8LW67_9FUNG|nr:Chitinase 2 [Coemansia guatemalensis]
MRQLALGFLFLCFVICGQAEPFNINCNSNLVLYWGQNSHAVGNPGENQLPLDEYCDKNDGDVLVLSFLSEFNADALHPPTLNFANSCVTSFDNSTLLHCSNIGKAVKKCQRQGKKVILSLGGASGAYGFADDVQAERYADQIWDMFLGGNSQRRPFDGSVLDGIDLDIEGGSSVGYVRFVQRLRERFTEVPERRFYVTAAPQCPYPDFYFGPILDNAYLDMVFVQFYNNYCGVDHPNWFNFEQWHEWATTISANKDVRVYMGVPGSTTAASTGYIPPDRLEEIVNATRNKFDTFGGMMVWDASQAGYNQVQEETTFANTMRRMLDAGKKCTDGSDDVASSSSEEASSTSTQSGKVPVSGSVHSSSTTSTTKSEKSEASSAGTTTSKAFVSSSSTTHKSTSSDAGTKSTRTKESTTTIVDEDGTATVMTNVIVSEVSIGGLSATDDDSTKGSEHLAVERLNRMAVGGLDEDTSESSATDDSTAEAEDADSSTADEASSDEGSTDTESTAEEQEETVVEEASSDESNGESEETTSEAASEDTEEAEQSSDASGEEESPSTEEEGNETTTVESTKVIHSIMTKTRKVHVVTKHVTTRIKKTEGHGIEAMTEAAATTTNKTVSIVTPTFPLPIARCPRADQPCLGAGFACNGYEFGQCVNNRWLMRPCSTDRVTACFNAGPDLIACDFPKGRSLQVCDDILAPMPYGRLASNVLFLRGADQERALNTPVYPVASATPSVTTPVKKKKKDDDDDDDDTDDDDDDYIYNKYGEKKKNTSMSTTTDMELVKQSSGVNLIDDHNRREDPAMLMAKDPEAYYGPDGHVRVVGGNVVDDLRKHNALGTASEPYDENPPVDDPEEADEYSEGDEFMRKRDAGAWDEDNHRDSDDVCLASSVPLASSPTPSLSSSPSSQRLAVRDVADLVGGSVSMAHLNERPWRAQLEDFYSIYALYAAFSGITDDLDHQQFERVILNHIDGDFLVPPRMQALSGHPLLAHLSFIPVRGEDPDYMHHRTKDGMVEQDILVVVRMLTNIPIPRRWRVALPLPLNATMLHTSRGSFYAGDRVSAEVKSLYMQRVAYYNENIRLTTKNHLAPESQKLNDLAAGHSSNASGPAARDFDDGPSYDSVRRSLISPAVISEVLHKRPSAPPPPELLDEPVANDPAGRLYEVRSNPEHESERSMALYFNIRIKTHPTPEGHVINALPHPILSFITTY